MSKQIPLRNRKGEAVAFAVVDNEDYGELSRFRWYLGTKGYVTRQYREPSDPRGKKRNRAEFMHRRLLGLGRGDRRQGDHKNLDKLDNRRSNLRIVTNAENQQNKYGCRASSGHRNVVHLKDKGVYYARVILDGKQYVGRFFRNPLDAAKQAIQMRKELHPCALRLSI